MDMLHHIASTLGTLVCVLDLYRMYDARIELLLKWASPQSGGKVAAAEPVTRNVEPSSLADPPIAYRHWSHATHIH